MHHIQTGVGRQVPAARLVVTDGLRRALCHDLVAKRLADGLGDGVLLVLIAIGAGDAAAVGAHLLDGQAGHQAEQVDRGPADAVQLLVTGRVVRRVAVPLRFEVGLEVPRLICNRRNS